jgi:hypothetical protein
MYIIETQTTRKIPMAINLNKSEPHRCTIEYVDAKGEATMREIDIYNADVSKDGDVVLTSFCSMRMAWRTFRADRVVSFIDADGVVHDDISRYMRDTLGLPADMVSYSAEQWDTVFAFIKPYATLFCVIADADGVRTKEEITVAVRAIGRLCRSAGLEFCGYARRKVFKYIEKMEITDEQLASLDNVDKSIPKPSMRRMISNICMADGTFCQDETRLFDAVMAEVFGH